MEVLDFSQLRPYSALPYDLYHISGNILLRRGTPLSGKDLEVFKAAGIEKVFALTQEDSVTEFRRSREYRNLPVDELPRGTPVPRNLVVGGKIIAKAGEPITDEIVEEMKKNGMDSILVKRSGVEMQLDQYQQLMTRLAGYPGFEGIDAETMDIFEAIKHDSGTEYSPGTTLEDELTQVLPVEQLIQEPEKQEQPKAAPVPVPKKISREEVEQKLVIQRSQLTSDPRWSSEMSIQKVLALGGATVLPSGDPLIMQVADIDYGRERAEETRKKALEEFESCLLDLNRVFDLLLDGEPIEGDLLTLLARKLIAGFAEDHCLVLNFVNYPVTRNSLLRHSLDSAIIGIAIGAQLGFSADQVLELAFGALLHDVGMFKVNETIRNKPEKLDPAEWGEIREHPAHNLSLIRQIKSIPKSAPILAYQVHERSDRSGYPLHQPPEMIHTYAKITAIADAFTAMIKNRPYRLAIPPAKAVREIVKLGAERKLDIEMVRAFLFAVCYFPVGSLIRLSDGRMGKVVGPNRDDYTRPVVAVLDESGAAHQIQNYIDLADEKSVGIIEGLPGVPENTEKLFVGF
ncbi:MAG: HD-GYP domain-containing protein [Planctomycetota bacterium]|jgi:HD-GYP domain-containing protein (c-di-GMP phosphodiesterase class II)